jgi:hypothetical protein
MSKSETYFEQVPVEFVTKIAKVEIPDIGEIVKTPRKKTKRKVERVISDERALPKGKK